MLVGLALVASLVGAAEPLAAKVVKFEVLQHRIAGVRGPRLRRRRHL